MHLTANFHHPKFNRSEVIVLTNNHTDKMTNKHTPLKTSTSLRYATPWGNKSSAVAEMGDRLCGQTAAYITMPLVYGGRPQPRVHCIRWGPSPPPPNNTRRPASADRTARRQFEVTGQPVSRTQASDSMTSRLPRYEARVCNAGASNAGRSLCVQISRERSYPLPIY